MANTKYLREVVEEHIRRELKEEFGTPFASRVLELVTGGSHEFDAVSDGGAIVASVKSASGPTATGKVPSGKIKDSIAELYYLGLVRAERRFLVLTTPTFFQIFMRTMEGRIAQDLEVRCMPLPETIQTEVDKIVAEASAEVSPEVSRVAVAAEVEAEVDAEENR